ncbi:MAG: hypothetical protein MJZ25_14040 [Fibrobacter sp.]|nr:hypothetical protein [Fibrobacter sp.]
MKKIVLALIMFLSFNAFAQEMDTTLAVTADGETVGLVHQKGMLPVVPEGMRLLTEESSDNVVPAEVSDENAVAVEDPAPFIDPANREYFGATVDSVEYYQNLIDRYTTSGTKMSNSGVGLMIGGGIVGVLGCLMMADADEEDDLDDGIGEFFSGYMLFLAGAGAVTTGVVFKIVGGAKLRRAHRYEGVLHDYEKRNAVSVRVAPFVNPVNKSLGGALAMNF